MTILCMEKGEKLAMARRYNAPPLNQHELAALLAVNRSTLARWESKNTVPADIVSRAAALLNVKDEWFYDGTDTPPTVARRIGLEEPSNVRAVPPEDMTRAQQLLVEQLWVALPVWRGVLAGSDEDEECAFIEGTEPEFREIPAFLTMGQPDRHVLCLANGMSMAPKVEHAERVIVKLDPDVPPGHIVVARSEDNRNFIKKLVKVSGRLELHSLNEGFQPIVNVRDWTIKGGAVAIMHNYEGKPNIEWDEGRYLRA